MWVWTVEGVLGVWVFEGGPVEACEVLDCVRAAGGEWNGAGGVVFCDGGADIETIDGFFHEPEVGDE